MDFFKVKKLRKPQKADTEKDLEDKPDLDQSKVENNSGDENVTDKSSNLDSGAEAEEDDDDFITNEVKRRLKELRRNKFMVLIPEEESCPEDEEEEDDEADRETGNFDEWRDVEEQGRKWWNGFEFDAVYDKYCERMLFFDRMMIQQLKETGCHTPSTPSPKSASKKLPSPFRCLSLKKIEEPIDEIEEKLQQPQNDPFQDLETAYVAQLCLTWEALHCQYTQLTRKISRQLETTTCYNHSAQQFQQFQVLLQRFIENEPFQQGTRAEIYAHSRNLLPKLLQVPNGKVSDEKEMEEMDSDLLVLAPDLIRVVESSILTFRLFLKMDKKKSNGVLNLFGHQNHMATPLQLTQYSLDKKKIKLKEVCKKSKGWKKKCWPNTYEYVELLFGMIDVKIMSRVLRMVRISKEQLIWCEEKMKKLGVSSDGKLQRDPSPLLFPC